MLRNRFVQHAKDCYIAAFQPLAVDQSAPPEPPLARLFDDESDGDADDDGEGFDDDLDLSLPAELVDEDDEGVGEERSRRAQLADQVQPGHVIVVEPGCHNDSAGSVQQLREKWWLTQVDHVVCADAGNLERMQAKCDGEVAIGDKFCIGRWYEAFMIEPSSYTPRYYLTRETDIVCCAQLMWVDVKLARTRRKEQVDGGEWSEIMKMPAAVGEQLQKLCAIGRGRVL